MLHWALPDLCHQGSANLRHIRRAVLILACLKASFKSGGVLCDSSISFFPSFAMHILFNFIWEASVAVIDLVWNFSGCAVQCGTVPLQALWAVLIRALWVSTMGLSTFHIAAMATLSPSPNVLLIEWHLIRPWNTTPKLTKRAREGRASKPAKARTGVQDANSYVVQSNITNMWWFEASSCKECMLSNKRQIFWYVEITAAPIRKIFMHNSWKNCLCWKLILHTCLLLLI